MARTGQLVAARDRAQGVVRATVPRAWRAPSRVAVLAIAISTAVASAGCGGAGATAGGGASSHRPTPAAGTSASQPSAAPGILHRAAREIVLQSGEVNGLQPCVSMAMGDFLNSGKDSSTERDQRDWAAAVSGGATDSWVEVFAQDAGQCPGAINGAASRWVATAAITFQSADQAQTAWTSGLFLGMSPSTAASLGGGELGAQTGLGEQAVTGTLEGESTRSGVAYWARGSTLGLVTSQDAFTALTLAKRMTSRM